ncbi:hypothetical protein EUX98_g3712 [Antrodiella citrinella]|uniref:Uncharacterized protein n=1 Tax=Antrodiella citrinella TaxID=2447956 RepID=A0A4S4MWY2_9APHY|nr:hypothetical protein EUX98_g3712 [Antrodiella citrinella]
MYSLSTFVVLACAVITSPAFAIPIRYVLPSFSWLLVLNNGNEYRALSKFNSGNLKPFVGFYTREDGSLANVGESGALSKFNSGDLKPFGGFFRREDTSKADLGMVKPFSGLFEREYRDDPTIDRMKADQMHKLTRGMKGLNARDIEIISRDSIFDKDILPFSSDIFEWFR